MKIKPISVFALFLFFTSFSFAQDLGSETVEVVKPYTPSVSDAPKIREVPKISDSVSLEKVPVQYSIFSVPVASTFTPAKGRAATVERQRPPKLYNNYITLGFGTYTSALAEFYSNIEVSRSDNFGIFLTHNSAQGGIDEVVLDDHFYDTDLNLNYSSRNRDLTWNLDFGAGHQQFNWYGVDQDPFPAIWENEIDPQHNYYNVYTGGEVNWEKSFFDRAEARYRFFGDDYGSTEHRLHVKPTLELPIGGEIFHTNLIFDYLNGGFERSYFSEEGTNYSFLNTGLASSLLVLRDDLTLNLGAAIYYSFDSENSDGGIYVYPQVTASYRFAGDYFIGYAGLEGELRQNSYFELVQRNPFVSPTLEIQPTDRQYDLYVGAKGKLSNSVGYNVRANYLAENFKPLFVSNPAYTSFDREDYSYDNSFSVFYDRVSTISAFGELNFDVRRNLNLRLNATYFVYDTDEQLEAWNLPSYEANVMMDWQITDKWFAGANVFMVGERKDLDLPLGITTWEEIPESTVIDLDAYVDLNANLGYRFNDRLSIFAKGHNLLGNSYEKWDGFPVLGLQVMAGATYKFDFGN